MSDSLFSAIRVAIRGGGDLGSGVAYRLFRAGFPVLITELAHPKLVRRAVAYGSAAIEGSVTVDGVTARRADSLEEALAIQRRGEIAVLIDPEGKSLPAYDPVVLVDARMLKRDPGPQPIRAPLVIGMGPGFTAPVNCDAALETKRGHNLGRVIWRGSAEANTGEPGQVGKYTGQRVLRAPADGIVRGLEPIGAMLRAGQIVAEVNGQAVAAPFDGVLRGLVRDGLYVSAGTKIGDVDPRGERDNCFTISDKSLALGGAALEAVLSHPGVRRTIQQAYEAG